MFRNKLHLFHRYFQRQKVDRKNTRTDREEFARLNAGSSGFNLLDVQKSFESQTFQIVLLIKRVLYCCRCVGKQKPEIQFETFKQKPVLKQFKTIQPEIQSFQSEIQTTKSKN